MTRVAIHTKGGGDYGWGHVVRSTHIVPWIRHHYTDQVEINFYFEGNNNVADYVTKSFNTDVGMKRLSFGSIPDSGVRRFDLCIVCLLDPSHDLLAAWRKRTDRLLVFDELKRTPPFADVLVQAQLTLDAGESSPAPNQIVLKGPECFVIPVAPSEIDRFRERQNLSTSPPYNVLVMIGGSANGQAMLLVANAIQALGDQVKPTFIIGYEGSEYMGETIGDIVPHANVLYGVGRPMEYMSEADLGIFSGGYSKYEAAFCGLPIVMLSVHDHQRDISRAFADTGAGIYLGPYISSTPGRIRGTVRDLLSNPHHRDSMSTSGQDLIDGRAAERILTAVDGNES